jgi:hypothetical protein
MDASWNVLRKDKRILIFPLLSGISCLLVMFSFAMPIYLTQSWRPPSHDAAAIQQVVYYGTLFSYYFVNYLVITFFNVALVACAIDRMRGGSPDIAFGFNAAAARIHLIVGWALVSATVGMILRVIEERSKLLGRIVAGLLGVAWGIGSYLVVPLLVVERKGPFDALKESAALLRKNWGERVAVTFGFGGIQFLASIPGIAIVGIGIYFGITSRNWTAAGAIIGLGVLYFIVLALVFSALKSIFQAALYLYASGVAADASTMPQGFPVILLQQAVRAK